MTKDLSNISPVVNSAGKTSSPPGFVEKSKKTQVCSDHDLHFVASGRGTLVVDDAEYHLEKGDVLLVYPGENFNIYTEGDENFARYYIHFDFYNTNKLKRKTPILPNGKKWPRIVHIQTDAEIRTICSAIVYHHMHNQSMVSPIITGGELKALLGLVLNTYLNTKDSHQFRRIKSYKNIIKAEKFIRANYQKDITLQDMAREANLSETYFGNIFKKIIGKSPIDYLTSKRINHAKRLLIETDYNISEVSSLVGYEDSHYFSYIFKQKEGITPSEFLASLSETV
ncbi:MAG: AraC family transcriptional regulator [bacterium]|nr:AraC family transcriptional regulator [bacterium]